MLKSYVDHSGLDDDYENLMRRVSSVSSAHSESVEVNRQDERNVSSEEVSFGKRKVPPR